MNNSIVSIISNEYTYTGGAHGSAGIQGYNFFISPVYQLQLNDLFLYEDHEKVLNYISEFCFEELRKAYNEGFGITDEEEIKSQNKSMFWENSLDSEWDNFDNFLVSKENISIIFNQYQVSSYAFGMHIIDISIQNFKTLDINLSLVEKLENKLR